MLFPLFQLRFGWQVLQFHRQPVEIFRRQGSLGFTYTVSHRLNMEVDLQSLFGLHVTWCALHSCAHWLSPRNPPIPPYTRALLVSKDRRHLWCKYLYNDLVRTRFIYTSVLKSFTLWDYLSKYMLRASIIPQWVIFFSNKASIFIVRLWRGEWRTSRHCSWTKWSSRQSLHRTSLLKPTSSSGMSSFHDPGFANVVFTRLIFVAAKLFFDILNEVELMLLAH